MLMQKHSQTLHLKKAAKIANVVGVMEIVTGAATLDLEVQTPR